MAAEFTAKNVTILGVSFDKQKANAAFAAKNGFEFQLLCDTERVIGRAYNAARMFGPAKRISYLIDPEGKIAKAWSKVNVRTHPDAVLAAIA